MTDTQLELRADEIASAMIERIESKHPPLVVAVIDGGLIQYEYLVAGVGQAALDRPELEVLDFDREGSDFDDLRDFIAYAKEVAGRLKDRGEDPIDILKDIERVSGWLDD